MDELIRFVACLFLYACRAFTFTTHRMNGRIFSDESVILCVKQVTFIVLSFGRKESACEVSAGHTRSDEWKERTNPGINSQQNCSQRENREKELLTHFISRIFAAVTFNSRKHSFLLSTHRKMWRLSSNACINMCVCVYLYVFLFLASLVLSLSLPGIR